MFISANTLQLLMDKGLTGEDLLEVYRALEADFRSTQPVPQEHTAQDRKRARDADRMAEKRRQERQSRDSRRDVAEQPPLPLPLSPQTPLTPTPTPPDISTRARGVAIAKPNGFAKFWELYPNKVGKTAAERAYSTACRKIAGPDPPAVLLEGLERAKASRQWLEGYIPHPTTWLNQGRWEDEPEPPRQALQTTQAKPNEPNRPDAKRAAREANYARAFAAPVLASGGSWD